MSNIDTTVPILGEPTTASVRDNFLVAANEIDAATATANGAVQRSGDTMQGGLHFGSTLSLGVTDISRHVDLWGGTFGLNVTSARLNIVSPASTVFVNQQNSTDLLIVNSTQVYSYVPFYVDRALVVDPVAGIEALKPITMATGQSITLAADPASALQAATKQYVDSKAGAGLVDAPNDGNLYARMSATWSQVLIPAAATTLPVMNGAAAIGTGTTWARADHVHASDTTRAPLANPTFTGAVNAPTPALSGSTLVATTAYVSTNAPLLTSQSGGTVDYNAIDQAHFGLHNFGGPSTSTVNHPPGIVSPAKATVLSTWAANTGWATQMYMGAEAGVPNLFYRVMPGNATWGSWSRIITDAGGVMTGPLVQAADPATALGTATKQYVDAGDAARLPLAGGTMSGGVHFGSAVAPGGTADLSRHLDLNGGTFGFSITSARLNMVVPAGSSAWINAGGIDALQITPTVVNAMVGLAFPAGILDSAPNSFANHISLFGTGYGIGVTAGQINIVSTNRVCFIDQAGNTISMQVSRTGVVMNVAATGVAPGVGDNSAAIPTTAWCTAAFAPHAALDAMQAQIDALKAALAANNITV